jgi:hypothetical protein
MQIDYHKMTRDFLLGENKEAGLMEYLSVVSEMIDHFKPMRDSDKARLMVMRENLRKAKKHARIMQERLSILEEQVKIIEEQQEDDE